jgi:spore coat protein U-like protein
VKLLLCLTALAALPILPTFVWAQSCTFNGGVSSIGFGSLDPSAATTRTAFSDVKVKCNPASGTTPIWQFSGANGNAPLRMKHSTQSAFIPYSVAASFQGNSGVNQNWRLTATVLATDYQNALVGTYSDTLTATITP